MAGWVEKRGESKWRLNVNAGVNPNGSRKVHRKTVNASSERQAKKLLALFSAEILQGQYVEPSKITFKDFSERWLQDYAETNLAPKTVFHYKQLLELRIFPAFGNLKLGEIRPVDLLALYKNIQESGRLDGRPGKLSNNTIHHYHRLLSAMFNDAVEWQVLPSSPVAKVKPPRIASKRAACYDESQIEALLAALEEEELKYQVLVSLAIFTGLRRGELMGLEWKDVNFNTGTMEVRRASQYLPGHGTFTKSPKNASSIRLLSVPTFLVDMLKQLKVEQAASRLKVGNLWQGSGRIFTTWDGNPMHPDTASSWFPEFLKKHGLPHLSLHGLRHTSATLLINQKVPLINISGRLGHANTSTTANIYSHYLQSADKATADTLEKFYQDTKNEQA